jgi:hypothetical protein
VHGKDVINIERFQLGHNLCQIIPPAPAPSGSQIDPQRARLVDAAAYALWNFVVQRECSGFRETEQVLKDYAVPVEVREDGSDSASLARLGSSPDSPLERNGFETSVLDVGRSLRRNPNSFREIDKAER